MPITIKELREQGPIPISLDAASIAALSGGGSGGGGTAQTYTAAVPISGYKGVAMGTAGAVYASNDTISHARLYIGISTGAVVAGDQLTVYHPTEVATDVTWSWTPFLPVWLGRNGALTQVEPSASAGDLFSLVVAYALSATRLYICQGEPVLLS